MFGGGPYSVAGSAALRVVGRRKWPVAEISVAPAGAATRTKSGHIQRQRVPPFMPKSFRDPYHPGGNSLCYMIQTAHLMGCSPIYCLGFTLSNGTGYFFGLDNPVTNRRSFYSDPGRALEWLQWYDKWNPGRAKLWPGWSGPIYEVLKVVGDDEARQLCEGLPALERGHEPDPVVGSGPDNQARRGDHRPQPVEVRRHVQRVEQLRPNRQREPVRGHGVKPVRRQQPKGRVIGG